MRPDLSLRCDAEGGAWHMPALRLPHIDAWQTAGIACAIYKRLDERGLGLGVGGAIIGIGACEVFFQPTICLSVSRVGEQIVAQQAFVPLRPA
jgi:hypothetical protein